MKSRKRILSVTVKRMVDQSPDTSYLGEYSNRATSEFSIDRNHAEDCASQEYNHREAVDKLEHVLSYLQALRDAEFTQDPEPGPDELEALDAAYDEVSHAQEDAQKCDCNGGDRTRGEYEYFNPSFNYVDAAGRALPGNTPEEVRKYVREDYNRMESLNKGDWWYIGIRAEAEIALDTGAESRGALLTQTITSGGLWGIESDSDASYINDTAKEELADLKHQLAALGFSKRAISQAFKPENVKERDA